MYLRGAMNRFFVLLCVLGKLRGEAATLHVWADSPNPMPPYTNEATAAHTLEAAWVLAQPGDTVLVHPRTNH